MRALFGLVCGCFVMAVCPAAELYTFTYAAAAGPIQSFSFSFLTPGFATDGSSAALAPFTTTDSARTWTMSNELAAAADGFGCFMFGTDSAQLGGLPMAGGSCSVSPGAAGNNQAAFWVTFYGGLPESAGTYLSFAFGGVFNSELGPEWLNGFGMMPGGNGTLFLTVSDVETPEPASLGLVAIGLAALAGAFIKLKRARG